MPTKRIEYMATYTKYPPRICDLMENENKEEAKVGANVRIAQPDICKKPLMEPINCFGAVSAATTCREAADNLVSRCMGTRR